MLRKQRAASAAAARFKRRRGRLRGGTRRHALRTSTHRIAYGGVPYQHAAVNSLLNLLYTDDALEALAVVGDGHARDAAGLARDLRAVCRADGRVLHTVACAFDALVVFIEQPQVEALAHAERDIRQGEVIAALGCVLEAAAHDELGRLAAHRGPWP